MPWKIIKLDKKIVIIESEDIGYEFDLNGFNFNFKNKDMLNEILDLCQFLEESHKRISKIKLRTFINEIRNKYLTMDLFRWFNTWVVTRGDTYGKGNIIANEISRKLLGLDNTNMDRWAGEEMGQKYEFTDNQIFLELSKKIKNM